ncbi:MAG: lamin tail domain-containing protein [Candidatus Marinimicrobia bacterium]|nr:lamin tail domain-containing protein [Candidatus Neomarinimicrobiota bacterium]
MQQDHLIFTELVLQPSAGEYVVIKNPTASDVDLADYYITDATDAVNGKYYYQLPGGADYWSGSGSDFIVRFPDISLPAGESLVLSLGRDSDYYSEYGTYPDLYMTGSGTDTMRYAVAGQPTIGGSPNAKLDNSQRDPGAVLLGRQCRHGAGCRLPDLGRHDLRCGQKRRQRV